MKLVDVIEVTPQMLLRIVALALAVWSHGKAEGKARDDCFPARARRFLEFIEKGE